MKINVRHFLLSFVEFICLEISQCGLQILLLTWATCIFNIIKVLMEMEMIA